MDTPIDPLKKLIDKLAQINTKRTETARRPMTPAESDLSETFEMTQRALMAEADEIGRRMAEEVRASEARLQDLSRKAHDTFWNAIARLHGHETVAAAEKSGVVFCIDRPAGELVTFRLDSDEPAPAPVATKKPRFEIGDN